VLVLELELEFDEPSDEQPESDEVESLELVVELDEPSDEAPESDEVESLEVASAKSLERVVAAVAALDLIVAAVWPDWIVAAVALLEPIVVVLSTAWA